MFLHSHLVVSAFWNDVVNLHIFIVYLTTAICTMPIILVIDL